MNMPRSANESLERKFYLSEYHLDKGVLPWEGGAYWPVPIFFDGGGDMREVFGHGLFDLGTVWQIARLPIGPLSDDSRLVIYHCINILRGVASDKNNTQDMPDAVSQMKYIADKLDQLVKDPAATITSEGRDIFIYDISTMRTLLFSELGKLSIIVLEEKRGYSVNTIWKHQWKLFPQHYDVHLSVFVTQNIGEAAKCLVLDCYTAVGFHAMRAVECVSRKYYEHITGKSSKYTDSSGKERDKGLGQIGQELVDKYTSLEHHKPKKLPSGNLGIIAITIQTLCKTYRDPLSHPDIISLDEDQAISTFTHAIEVISSVISDAKTGGAHFANPPTVVVF